MLVAIMVFFFIFGMIGLERSKRNGFQADAEAEQASDETESDLEI